MLLHGVQPKVVSERLGHASVGITLDTYSHVLPAMQAEAIRAFDDLFAGGVGSPWHRHLPIAYRIRQGDSLMPTEIGMTIGGAGSR